MIDPRAVVDPSASLAEDVSIGPFSVIGAQVEVGRRTWIGPQVVIKGPTRIGEDNRIFQFSSIGEDPQDKKYRGEPTWLEIGHRNTIREFCTLNRGTAQDRGATRIGDDNWIMAYVHMAHDCLVGNRTVFANGASIAGHVEVQDDVILGGFTLVHQFCRVGAHAITGFGSGLRQDVPPFMTVAGHPAVPHGINAEGLKRRGIPREEIQAVRRAYKLLYRSDLKLESALAQIRELADSFPRLQVLVDFLSSSRRGIAR